MLSTGGAFTAGILWLAWFAAGLAWFIALVWMLIAAVDRRPSTVSGILVGLAIGFLALTLTCFANIATLGPIAG